MQPRPFGETPAGEPVQVWAWTNANGAKIAVSEMGATLVSLEAPDREGRLADVTLGFEGAEPYAENGLYAGAIVGRFANRIANATFALNGRRHVLSANAPPHCLHGGDQGLHQKLWSAEPSADGRGLRLRVASPAEEGGFPGEMQASAEYRWTDDNVLMLELNAMVDAPCPVNLAPHPYWNLDGHSASTIQRHWLQIDADAFTPAGPDLIPQGRLEALSEGLDFRVPSPLERSFAALGGHGLDHNFVLRGEGLRPVARLWSPRSHRRLTLSTDRPGLQVYTLNACPLGLKDVKDGCVYGPHSGIALEPQAFPDSPNQSAFPTAILKPGDLFKAFASFAFDVVESI